jgi:hypothetical protein
LGSALPHKKSNPKKGMPQNEKPRSKLLGIKDCTLKSLRMVGEQIPHTPSFPQQAAGY